MKPRCLLLGLLLGPASLSAQEQDASVFRPDSIRREIRAERIGTALKIDGQLRESEWRLTAPSTRFVQIEPFQGKAPSFDTDVRVL